MAAVGHHDVASVDERGRGAHLLEQEAFVAVRAGLLFQEIPGIGRERRRNEPADVELRGFAEDDAVLVEQADGAGRRDGSEDMARVDIHDLVRSEERRGGQEGVSTCRSRWWAYPLKNITSRKKVDTIPRK